MTNEWKPIEINEGQPINPELTVDPDWYRYKTKFPDYQLIHNPKLSNWTCYLFGGSPGDGIAWTPHEGKVPNAWFRFWMKVFFNCHWVKKDK